MRHKQHYKDVSLPQLEVVDDFLPPPDQLILNDRMSATNVSHPGSMMSTLPPCPQCNSTFTYEDGQQYICPECAHEWNPVAEPVEASGLDVRDAHGNPLKDGDAVTVIKDLKVKGSSLVVKVGTKVKSIKLVEGDHNIDCKVDGIGAMQLKSEFVKKA